MSSREIEAVFPPTPLQQGLLFHSLSGEGEGVYVTQHVIELLGEIDNDAFRDAWQGLVDRHQALRSCFRWRDTEKPLTVIRRQARLPVDFSDWSEFDDEAQQQRLEEWLQDDKRRGFQLDQPPLLRLRLIRRGPGRHWLYWANHHAVLDGWSAALLATEALVTLADRGVVAPDSADQRPQWTDYLRWLQNRDLEGARTFWRETLADLEAPCRLDLPPPPGNPRPGYGRTQRKLSELLCTRLADTARTSGATPAVIAQAAWALVLDRYGPGADVVFGLTSSGRPPGLPGVDRIAGLFINTLPLRVRLDPLATVRSLFEQVRLSAARLREHEHAPLSLALAESGLAPGDPLFDTLMVFENYPVDERLRQGQGGLRVADVRVIEETNYPLSLVVGPGRRWTVDAIYQQSRLSKDAVEGLVSDYLRMLSAIARNPDQRIGELTALRCDVAGSRSNEPPPSFDPPRALILDRITDQATQRPDAPAVRDDAQVLSYADLQRAADRLALRLTALGAGPEAPVAIALDRGVSMLVAILGALRAGAPYTIVGAAEAEERLRDVMTALAPRAVVTDERSSPTLPRTTPHVVLQEQAPFVESSQANHPPPVTDPANTAYVLFTSGSTGGPKGVQVTHQGLTVSTAARFAFYRTPVRAFLLLSPFSFDSSVAGIFWTLASGGELVVPNEQERRDPERIVELIKRRAVSHLLAVPSFYELVLEAAGRKNVPAPAVAVVAGEACPASVVHRHFEVWPSAELVNEYGPTEATVWATAYRCSPADSGPPPIGRPIPGATALVLDRHGRPAPAGVSGELFLGGQGLARGYLGAPSLTAARFPPHAFGSPGERLYRTGDRVRRLPSGDFEFLGRLDRQIKLSGQRIELEEIERAILATPNVREAAVELMEDDGPPHLIGFVRPTPDAAPSESELRDRLRRRLPGYMVPAALVLVDDFPRNAHGKIDRSRLPRSTRIRAKQPAAQRPPADELETRIALCWQDVLELPNIGCDEPFFDVGGDSLALMRLAARLRREFELDVELQELLEADTVSRQADRLRPRLGSGIDRPAIPRVDRGLWHPLSSAQQRMWFFTRLADNAASAYNIPVCVDFRGPLDPAALASAFRGLIDRHETFRTRFRSGEDGPQQRVESRFRFDLEVVDLRKASNPVETTESRTLDFCRQSFDLEQPPLLRAQLFRLEDARWRLALVMPHLVADGWSSKVVFSELAERYRARKRSDDLELAPPALQPVDYAVWEQDRSVPPDWDYWRETLRDVPALELPADRTRQASKTYRGETFTTTFAPSSLQRIRAFAAEMRSSFFVVTLALWRLLLGRLSGQSDFSIGVPVAERDQAELQDAVGLFLDAAAIRVVADERASFRDLVSATRDAVTAAVTRPRPSLEQLLRDLQISPDPSRPPLFQVFFAVHPGPSSERLDDEISMQPLAIDPGAAKFDLTLSIEEYGDQAKLAWELDRDQFDLATVREFAALFAQLVDSALTTPDAPAGTLSWLNAEQSDALRCASSGPAPALPEPSVIHALFEAQAACRPSAAAVVVAGRTFSYRELDRRANAVARRLIALGVEAEDRVAVGLDRSLEQIVAVLGALKAGAAYAPFDPHDPPARTTFLLDDLQARVIICAAEQEHEMAPFSRQILVVGNEQSDRAPNIPTHPDQLANVLYTSGSTGRPKGVAVSHRSVVRLLTEPAFAALTPDTRLLVAAPLSFDASTFEIWGALLHGGCCLLTPPGPPSLDEIRKAGRNGADTAWLTASLFNLTVDEAVEAFAPYLQIVTGGEALSPAHVRKFRERYPDKRLVNGYGPTESTTFAAAHDVHQLDADATSVPIGKPIAHTSAWVLDHKLHPSPSAVAGDLYLGGLGLARGYWNRPGLTAQAFVPNPQATRPGQRLYRTGDLARRLPDGRLDFVGRSDRQVKIKGRRIEAAEIEAVLESHPDVRSCAVVARREATPVSLVAYVTPRNVRLDQLAPYVRARLPAYMAPDRYLALEALPLTRNGKVDLRSLPTPAPEPSHRESISRPTSPIERQLLSIWRELLAQPELGTDDDVFRAGADSLISIRFAERAARKRVAVGLADIFRNPTVRSLARVVRPPRTATRTADGNSKIPLSPSQALFLRMEHDNPHHYNLAQWFRAEGELTPRRLAQAAQALGTRHDALRLRFDLREKTAHAAPEPGPPPVEWIRLRSATPAERLAELEQAATRLQQSLRIDRGPLYRLAWFQGRTPEESKLFAVIHHLAADGASLWTLGEDLKTAISQALDGRTVRLAPPPPLRWSDWAQALEAEARGSSIPEWLALWRSRRSPSAVGLGPTPARRNRQHQERSLTSVLDPDLSQALEYASPDGARSVPYLLAAAAVAGIAAQTQAPAHAFDWVSHGRDPVVPGADPSRTVGYFTARTPTTLAVVPPERAQEAVTQLRAQLEAPPFHALGFGLARYLSAARASEPHGDFSFNFIGDIDPVSRETDRLQLAPDLPTGPSRDGAQQRVGAVHVFADRSAGRLRLLWRYSGALHQQDWIQAAADEAVRWLCAAAGVERSAPASCGAHPQ